MNQPKADYCQEITISQYKLNTFHTPAIEDQNNDCLILQTPQTLYLHEVYTQKKKEIKIDTNSKLIEVVDLTQTKYVIVLKVKDELFLQLRDKRDPNIKTECIIGKTGRNDAITVRYFIQEDDTFSLFLLQRCDQLQLSGIFQLHLFEIADDRIHLIQKVDLEATSRQLYLVPLDKKSCVLYCHSTISSKPFQFIYWSQGDQEIKAFLANEPLKGTVVHILPFLNSENKSIEVGVFYNTFGGNSPNIMIYNLKTKVETHKRLFDIDTQPQLLIQVLPNIQDGRYCYLVTTQLQEAIVYKYDYTMGVITQIQRGGFGLVKMFKPGMFFYQQSEITDNIAVLKSFETIEAQQVSYHYLVKCNIYSDNIINQVMDLLI